MVPQFWDAVRNEVDNREDDGQFMLTGSAVPGKARKDDSGNSIGDEQIFVKGVSGFIDNFCHMFSPFYFLFRKLSAMILAFSSSVLPLVA